MRDDVHCTDGIHACLGVYVIDGRAAGVYARVSRKPLIDGRAQDAAVLLDPSLEAEAHARPEHPLLAQQSNVPKVPISALEGVAA